MGVVVVASLLLGANALASEMPAMAKKHECSGCHEIDARLVGPSWMEISRKYKGATKYAYGGKEYSLEDGLVMKVSRGGFGNWGAMPMPANDKEGRKQGEIRALVRFVLNLAR